MATSPDARVIAFGSQPAELHGVELYDTGLPEPSGSTALHLALELVAAGPRPSHLIVITDGTVDDPQAALNAARPLAPIVIDAVYVGPDGDMAALGFLRALSLAGGRMGLAWQRDLKAPETLAAELKLRLTGPAR